MLDVIVVFAWGGTAAAAAEGVWISFGGFVSTNAGTTVAASEGAIPSPVLSPPLLAFVSLLGDLRLRTLRLPRPLPSPHLARLGQ
jgi:hypothetical protein